VHITKKVVPPPPPPPLELDGSTSARRVEFRLTKTLSHALRYSTLPICRMQRAEDREVDDKDDRGGGRPGLLASISTSTSFNTITPTQRPPSKRKREDTHHEGDEGEDEQEDQEEKGSHEEIMPPYKSKVRVLEEYHIIGFISSGTYGRVYKARSKLPGNTKEYAIKKSGATFLYIF